MRVFERTGKGVALRCDGETLMRRAEVILREVEQVTAELRNRDKLGGDISFGLPPTVSEVLSGPLIEQFAKRHCDVRLRVASGYSAHVLDWLQNGSIDLAVVYEPRQKLPTIKVEPLITESLFLIERASDEAVSRAVTFEEAARKRLVLPGRNHGLRMLVEASATRSGIEIDPVSETDSLPVQIDLVKRGFGATILPLVPMFSLAASGALAAMIHPSLSIVLYGVLTGESIGALLIAGVLPGLLTAAMLLLGTVVSVKLNGSLAPARVERFSTREKLSSLKDIWPTALLASIVLGGIYTGTVSPSAAGTVGAVGAFLVALLKGRMTGALFIISVKRAAMTTASLFLIIIAGLLLSRFLLFSGSVTALTGFLTDSGLPPAAFMACLVAGYFVLGMFIDPISMMVITVPFIYPTVKAMGLDTIWFGIIVVKLIEVAAITPPVGINLFAVLSASDGQLKAIDIFKGILPFVVLEMIVLVILLCFPQIVTFLPSIMMSR